MNIFELSVIIVLMGTTIVFAILFFLNMLTLYYVKIINFIKFLKKSLKHEMHYFFKNFKSTDLSKKCEDMPEKNLKKTSKFFEDNSFKESEEELIAIISAAVYNTLESSKISKYKIKSITPLNNDYSLWKFAGLLENTNSIQQF